ncbi:hypothetical protein [Pareuzebyella sediminis]|uniref:hypothetical protein n=1 Tax=Pareuzebyella sediminis TaxID=2607998 RepID=UPI0011EE3A0D|nr:hypothetical protein [Pareuzebyella sediminis]
MKEVVCLLAIMLLLSCSNDKELAGLNDEVSDDFSGEVAWVRNYGGSGEDTAHSVIHTNDGGFAILGYSNSVDGHLSHKTDEVNDYWLLKLDGGGMVQWSKTYGGSKDDRGQSLVQTADGGFALTGYAMSSDGDGSNNEGFHDNWVLKLDAQGTIEWEKSFGFSGHDHSYDILQTDDDGFFFVGFLDITSARADGNTEKTNGLTAHGVGEFWGTKIDAEGNLQWRGYYGGTNNDRAHAVVQSDDGGFVLAGFSESDDFDVSDTQGSYDFWVVKVDSKGNLVWERSFGGTGIEIAQDIVKSADGGYVIAGNTFSNDSDVSMNKGASDVWLIKIDDQGHLIWEKTFGGTEFEDAQGVALSNDGGYIVVGNSKSNDIDLASNVGENDIWIIKTDAQGTMMWQKSFGGTGIDFGFDVVETPQGHIFCVGETSSPDFPDIDFKGKSDVVVIKIK